MEPSPLHDLETALDGTASLVDRVPDDQWERPSPCTGWSARDVVDHLVAGHRFFASALTDGGEPVTTTPAPDAATAYRDSARAMLDAFAAPGALERIVTLPIGTVPGAVALHLRLVEALVHGWDIAVATGQAPAGDEAVAERALRFTRGMLPEIPQEHRPFAPAVRVPEDATALDRLVGQLGRQRP